MVKNRSSSDLQFRYSEARKAAAQAVKMSEERSWEEIHRQTKYFGKLFGACVGKVKVPQPPLRIQLEHTKGWEGNPFTMQRILWKFVEPSKGNTHWHMRFELFWERGSLHVDRSGSSHTKIEIRKSWWWRRNSTWNVEGIERRRSTLVDHGVSGVVETWKNTIRLADRSYHSYIQERRS